MRKLLTGLALAGLVGGATLPASGCATTGSDKAGTEEDGATKAKSDPSHEKEKNGTGSHGGSS